MARLHRLRLGHGDARVVVPSFEVPVERVRELYEHKHVQPTDGMPTVFETLDGRPVRRPANPLMDPKIALIELVEGEPGFGRFRSPGFNLLVNVDAAAAYKALLKTNSAKVSGLNPKYFGT